MPLLVVLGINGRQGSSVANIFLSQYSNWRIRGLTSTPNSPASLAWRSRGVQIVEVDLHNERSIATCFAGATVIFAVTDYYSHFANRSLQTVAGIWPAKMEKLAGNQDAKIGESVVKVAAKVVGLQRFILSTLPNIPSRPTSLKGGYGLEAKMAALRYLFREEKPLVRRTSLMKVGFRMEDWKLTLERNDDGTLQFGTSAPGYVCLPWLNVASDLGSLARTLIFDAPSGQNLAAVSEWVSGIEICRLINEISGLTCRYRQWTQSELEALSCPNNSTTDFLAHGFNYQYFESSCKQPVRLAQQYGVPVPRTSFRIYLEKDLPRALEKLMFVPRRVGKVTVWSTGVRTSPETALADSEAVKQLGWQAMRTVNANGHDRSIFIGNHPM
ncbi:NAD(P)-binding protein [Byssothecium circinans]|uniref:NAD(P)-binding protein n=1 Tax=Byssothecium circinans TaxID=147558 RepID=A0A6A5TPT7_9PLEO|nr:NAD(P)-binding protein [Byssothecium circinans]